MTRKRRLGATLTDPVLMLNCLNAIRPLLDVDAYGQADVLADGVILIRYLFGLRGSSLVTAPLGPGATRATAAEIEAYIQTLIP